MSKGLDCNGMEKSGITHNSRDMKTEITSKWMAPQGFSGKFKFRATVVESFAVYWVCRDCSHSEIPSNTLPLFFCHELGIETGEMSVGSGGQGGSGGGRDDMKKAPGGKASSMGKLGMGNMLMLSGAVMYRMC